MNIYDKVISEILLYLDKINNDEEFKKINPGITAQEYLCAKVNPRITPKRIANILCGKAKRISINEVYTICWALNIDLKEFFKNIK